MRRLLLVTTVVSLLLFSGSVSALATTTSSSFAWEAGAGAVCAFVCPDVAMAGNGDTVTVQAQGSLDAATKVASGGGTFEHRNAAGTLIGSGTISATHLITFALYGCDTSGLPSNLCGGRAALAVTLVGHPASNPSATTVANGILEVTCLIGAPPPTGPMEGIRLNVQDLINFNKPVSGDTLFIKAS